MQFFRQLRPRQWSKNLLVFAALLFSVDAFQFEMIAKAVIGFFAFSFVAGFVYILNDYADLHADRNHPQKKFRPMASGKLKPRTAFALGGVMLVAALGAAYALNPLYTLLLVFYMGFNWLYSYRLKHVVIIDIMCIAAGFVMRAIAGGLIIHVPITSWFLLCTMMLSLFLAIGKRRQEFVTRQSGQPTTRKVLNLYSVELLDQLTGIVATATILSYSLFTFTSAHTVHLMWTIPLVIYGIFRYLYLIHIEKAGGSPEKVLLEDRHILVTVILYVALVWIILLWVPA